MLDVRRGQTRAGFYCQTSVSTDDEVRPCALCVLCACMHCVYAQRCRLPSCAQILQACSPIPPTNARRWTRWRSARRSAASAPAARPSTCNPPQQEIWNRCVCVHVTDVSPQQHVTYLSPHVTPPAIDPALCNRYVSVGICDGCVPCKHPRKETLPYVTDVSMYM